MTINVEVTGFVAHYRGDPTINPANRTKPLPRSEQQFHAADAVLCYTRMLNDTLKECERLGLAVHVTVKETA